MFLKVNCHFVWFIKQLKTFYYIASTSICWLIFVQVESTDVNFTNILRVALSNESFPQSFFVLTFKVWTYLGGKNIGADALTKSWSNWPQAALVICCLFYLQFRLFAVQENTINLSYRLRKGNAIRNWVTKILC